MATIPILCCRGSLVPIGGGLESYENPVRALYGFPHVIDWLDNNLPQLLPTLDEGRQSPIEQVDMMFYDFVSGEDLAYYEKSHSMRPQSNGIWELKTKDVRLIGWFVTRGTFIIAEIDS